MNKEFWLKKWQQGAIDFHKAQPHQLLVEHFSKLKLAQGDTVLLPLCGKTKDMQWLTAQGMQVLGVELSHIAVQTFFDELNITPNITTEQHFIKYDYGNITILVGDVFNLQVHHTQQVKAIYDRAALVALPATTRQEYARHLNILCSHGKLLLICFDYEQAAMQGPPFSTPDININQYFSSTFELSMLESQQLLKGFNGVPVLEKIWLGVPNNGALC